MILEDERNKITEKVERCKTRERRAAHEEINFRLGFRVDALFFFFFFCYSYYKLGQLMFIAKITAHITNCVIG